MKYISKFIIYANTNHSCSFCDKKKLQKKDQDKKIRYLKIERESRSESLFKYLNSFHSFNNVIHLLWLCQNFSVRFAYERVNEWIWVWNHCLVFFLKHIRCSVTLCFTVRGELNWIRIALEIFVTFINILFIDSFFI